MNEEIMKILLDDIQDEQIRFGECNIKLIFRNGKVQKYSLTKTKERLINPGTKALKENN